MKIRINQKGAHRLRKGHPWIFRSDLLEIAADLPGPVDVVSSNGKLLGQALYSPKSLIALRMMTRGEVKIGDALIRDRIQQANELRRKLFPQSGVYRLVFAEADGLPVGVMVVGPMFSEVEILALARSYENHYGWRPQRTPTLPRTAGRTS